MKKKCSILIALILLVSLLGISCSKQLSVDEYLQQSQKILEAYTQSTNLETNSIHDANVLFTQGEMDKGYLIIEVTEHLYAEELNKYYTSWNAITPPKEFAEYHSSVSNYYRNKENQSRMISSYAGDLVDGIESDPTKLTNAMLSMVDVIKQWDVCVKLLEQAIIKTSKK